MDMSADARELREENQRLRSELYECTLRLAELSHRDFQVPDGAVRDDYQKICQAIETWIDYASRDEDGDFQDIYRDALDREQRTHKLRHLGLDPERRAASDPKLKELKNLETVHYFILSLVIGRHIFDLLQQPYPVGMTKEQRAMLEDIEAEMLRMGKAPSRVYQWKSETLTALCASESFKKRKEEEVSVLWHELKDELSGWLSGGDTFSKHKDRLRQEVLESAVHLHQAMRCSIQQYMVSWRPEDGQQADTDSIGETDSAWTSKDLATWRTVTSSNDAGHHFHRLYPGVIRLAMEEGQEKLQLVKPVMVVHKTPGPYHARRWIISSAHSSPVRIDSLTKEPRQTKRHHRSRTSSSVSRSHSQSRSQSQGLFGWFAGGSASSRKPEERESKFSFKRHTTGETMSSSRSRRSSHWPTMLRRASTYHAEPAERGRFYMSHPGHSLNQQANQMQGSSPYAYPYTVQGQQPRIGYDGQAEQELYQEPEEMSDTSYPDLRQHRGFYGNANVYHGQTMGGEGSSRWR
ncbi:hypothetical protein VTN77DRAFT_9317 [Rasamsonia byssochlamydoides]|uniref:uncharacterized protein n=1 Tax=Rasamsonia byssochlamydoides TaxID=89139 RepID=UPI0037432B78